MADKNKHIPSTICGKNALSAATQDYEGFDEAIDIWRYKNSNIPYNIKLEVTSKLSGARRNAITIGNRWLNHQPLRTLNKLPQEHNAARLRNGAGLWSEYVDSDVAALSMNFGDILHADGSSVRVVCGLIEAESTWREWAIAGDNGSNWRRYPWREANCVKQWTSSGEHAPAGCRDSSSNPDHRVCGSAAGLMQLTPIAMHDALDYLHSTYLGLYNALTNQTSWDGVGELPYHINPYTLEPFKFAGGTGQGGVDEAPWQQGHNYVHRDSFFVGKWNIKIGVSYLKSLWLKWASLIQDMPADPYTHDLVLILTLMSYNFGATNVAKAINDDNSADISAAKALMISWAEANMHSEFTAYTRFSDWLSQELFGTTTIPTDKNFNSYPLHATDRYCRFYNVKSGADYITPGLGSDEPREYFKKILRINNESASIVRSWNLV
jgi:hypothetical protein